MEKMSWIKKVLLLLVVIAAILPAVSLTEWACGHYENYAMEEPDSETTRWLQFKVAQIHGLMGRQDQSAASYGNFYEKFKRSPYEVDQEDPRVAEARYRQAMAWYDRSIPNGDSITQAHKYFSLYLSKYQGSTRSDPDRDQKVQEYIEQCIQDGARYSLPNLRQTYWPPDGAPNYEP